MGREKRHPSAENENEDENAAFGKKTKQQVLVHSVEGSSDLVRRLLSVV